MKSNNSDVVVGAHPAVASLLQEQEQSGVEDLERRYSAKILVTPDERFAPGAVRPGRDIARLIACRGQF